MEIVKLHRNKQAQYQESLALLIMPRCTNSKSGESLVADPISNDFLYSRLTASLIHQLLYV